MMHWQALCPSTIAAPTHCLNIWSVLEWLGEVADVAGNVLVSVEGERYDRLHTRSVLYKKAAKTKAEKKKASRGGEVNSQ